MSDDKELYSIVVIGAMNPRIHTPAWYSHFELISKEQFEATSLSPGTVMAPQIAQFQLDAMGVLCLPDRWEIKTTRKTETDRIVAVTQKIFDELLMHTPVFAVGFNFLYQKKTQARDVGRLLASRLALLPFGLERWSADSGELSLRRSSNNKSNGLAIGPSPEADAPTYISIAFNCEYRFIEPGQFKLEDEVFPKYASDLGDAEQQSLLIVQSINEMSK